MIELVLILKATKGVHYKMQKYISQTPGCPLKKSTDTINTSFTSHVKILELLCITIFPTSQSTQWIYRNFIGWETKPGHI